MLWGWPCLLLPTPVGSPSGYEHPPDGGSFEPATLLGALCQVGQSVRVCVWVCARRRVLNCKAWQPCTMPTVCSIPILKHKTPAWGMFQGAPLQLPA